MPARTNFQLRQTRQQIGNFAALLEPGDIVLFGSAKVGSDAVCGYQGLLSPPYSSNATAYSHASIFVGGTDIVHAVTLFGVPVGGVQRADLHQYAINRTVCAVRWPLATAAQRQALARQAQAMIGTPYRYTAIAAAAWHFVRLTVGFTSKNRNTPLMQHYVQQSRDYRRLICSEMVFSCYALVCAASNPLDIPGGGPSPIYTPADIYMNTALVTVGGPP